MNASRIHAMAMKIMDQAKPDVKGNVTLTFSHDDYILLLLTLGLASGMMFEMERGERRNKES